MVIDHFIIIDKDDFCSFLILRRLKKVNKNNGQMLVINEVCIVIYSLFIGFTFIALKLL